ncbi:hypothetical protein CD116_06395 [Staphylococcus schweitzeri]|uniref:Uncharacterized protein n=2 Tax=Staphylococcus schweitzeri TaxID=1654388 RepID=A0A2K4AI06_9STAP|nr:hypothetical protein CD116_06395 [Staphylococcus schweitzeri]
MLGARTPASVTRIEKSLLPAYFHSVNYCQYNIVAPRTLIYIPNPFKIAHQNNKQALKHSVYLQNLYRHFNNLYIKIALLTKINLTLIQINKV